MHNYTHSFHKVPIPSQTSMHGLLLTETHKALGWWACPMCSIFFPSGDCSSGTDDLLDVFMQEAEDKAPSWSNYFWNLYGYHVVFLVTKASSARSIVRLADVAARRMRRLGWVLDIYTHNTLEMLSYNSPMPSSWHAKCFKFPARCCGPRGGTPSPL